MHRPADTWWRGLPLSGRVALILGGWAGVVLFLDRPIQLFGKSLDPSARALLGRLTFWGDSSWSLILTLAVIAGGALAAQRMTPRGRVRLRGIRDAALYVFAVVAVSGLVASLTKNMIGRARPRAFDPPQVLHFRPMGFDSAFAAFPSGHSTTSLALAVALGLLFPRHRVAFLVLGLWAAASRALIGAHWFSDVIAGCMLGAATAVWLRRRFARRQIAFRPGPGGHIVARPVWPRRMPRPAALR